MSVPFRCRRDRRGRSAFTLVELMVVVLIIAILVSLISSAVSMALGKLPEVQTRTDISQLDGALGAFMADYNLSSPPPSSLVLYEGGAVNSPPLQGPSAGFLQQVFGKNLIGTGPNPPPGVPAYWVDWNGDNQLNGPWTLQGEQVLIFLTGGIPNSAAVATGQPPAPQGFSTNNVNPSTSGGRRNGPYLAFQTTRLYPQQSGSPYGPPANWNGFFVYLDSWQSKAGPYYTSMGGSPYAFFSSAGIANNYSATSAFGASPYQTSASAFTNPSGYQIISAGKDGAFGGGVWNPSNGATGAGKDDQANFSSKLLGVGQQ